MREVGVYGPDGHLVGSTALLPDGTLAEPLTVPAGGFVILTNPFEVLPGPAFNQGQIRKLSTWPAFPAGGGDPEVKVDVRVHHPDAPWRFLEVRHIPATLGGLVTIEIADGAARTSWAMRPAMVRDVVQALTRALVDIAAPDGDRS